MKKKSMLSLHRFCFCGRQAAQIASSIPPAACPPPARHIDTHSGEGCKGRRTFPLSSLSLSLISPLPTSARASSARTEFEPNEARQDLEKSQACAYTRWGAASRAKTTASDGSASRWRTSARVILVFCFFVCLRRRQGCGGCPCAKEHKQTNKQTKSNDAASGGSAGRGGTRRRQWVRGHARARARPAARCAAGRPPGGRKVGDGGRAAQAPRCRRAAAAADRGDRGRAAVLLLVQHAQGVRGWHFLAPE